MQARRTGRKNIGSAKQSRADEHLSSRDTADPGTPYPRGLYDPALDKDSCGVGFIADIKGRKSHKIVEDGLTILYNLEHRGAVGADPRTGDGAGILAQIPHKFFAKGGQARLRAAGARRIRGRLSVHAARSGLAADHPRHLCEMIEREGMTLLGWRDVPIDNSTLGESVKPTEPVHMQVFIGRGKKKDRGRVRAPALHPAQVDLRRHLPQA